MGITSPKSAPFGSFTGVAAASDFRLIMEVVYKRLKK